MSRPPHVVGLVTPWIEYADELEARIEELEADKQRLWDSIEAGESVYKRKCKALENAVQAAVDTDGPWREDSKQYIRAEWDMMRLREALKGGE